MREVRLDPDTFARMPNLKVLEILYSDKVRLPKGISALPDELRYLRWEGYPLKSLPANFDPENLIELCLACSDITELFCDEMQDLVKLKLIDLYGCHQLRNISNLLSRAPNVTELILGDCPELCEVSSIRHLSNAILIGLSYCSSLESLPDLSDLKSLVLLRLGGCSKLKTFPKLSRSIECLDLAHTAIEEVPATSMESLDNLSRLTMCDCSRLKSLPSNNVDLQSLEYLDLRNCIALKKFPEISKNTKRIYLDNTPITEVPSSVGCLGKLFLLSLNGCAELRTLPSTIRGLPYLEELELNDCKSLQSLPEFPPNLHKIEASGCTSLDGVYDKLTRLVKSTNFSHHRPFNFNFAGCLKLDEEEFGDMVCDLTKFITNKIPYKELKAIPNVFSIIYTGSRIPNCFDHHQRHGGDSIGFQLSSNMLNRGFMGFALGIVYKPCGPCHHQFSYTCHIGDNEFSSSLWINVFDRSHNGTETEHVLVTFDCKLRDEIIRIPRKSQSCDDVVVLKFESERFSSYDVERIQGCCEIKMCGVIPLYAQGEGYNTFQVQALEAQPPKECLKRRKIMRLDSVEK